MKVKQEIDLTTIITVLGFIGAMVVWGIRLESQVSGNSASQEAYETMQDKLQAIRWENTERRIDSLRKDVTLLESLVRDKE